MFRAWEIETARVEKPLPNKNIFPNIYFRHVEKIMLYLAKYIIQWIVLVTVKYWFIFYTKTKKLIKNKLPKIHCLFSKKPINKDIHKNSFINKAILESRIKIRNIKEKIIREHERQ